MKKLSQTVEIARKKSLVHSYIDNNIPQWHLIKNHVINKKPFKKDNFVLTKEYYLILQTFSILLVYKMNIETYMNELNHSGIKKTRKLLREIYKDEKTFINYQKTHLEIFLSYSIQKEVQDNDLTIKKICDIERNDQDFLHELKSFPEKHQKLFLEAITSQIILGESYQKVATCLNQICQRFPLLIEAMINEGLLAPNFLIKLTCNKTLLISKVKHYIKGANNEYKKAKVEKDEYVKQNLTLAAITYYSQAIIVLLISSQAPLFDFSHNLWKNNLEILNVNLGRALYLHSGIAGLEEGTNLGAGNLQVVKFAAIISKNKPKLIKMLEWEAPILFELLRHCLMGKLPKVLINIVNQYSLFSTINFNFPSEENEKDEIAVLDPDSDTILKL